MYDDARTREALEWLNGCGRQVILFTCQNREETILSSSGKAAMSCFQAN